ncbi:hypothetical protein [Xylella fastidiosa]|uniref:hypothetical protein n=1 Tax=Xylella fastidiosa TaxID=2371 RepID=UPI0012F730B1|nr:hypothetical protein [Xylella fastidiosa]MDG5822641.1 hypothetical protein [Xylella fastidiosa subsp. pauca]
MTAYPALVLHAGIGFDSRTATQPSVKRLTALIWMRCRLSRNDAEAVIGVQRCEHIPLRREGTFSLAYVRDASLPPACCVNV